MTLFDFRSPDFATLPQPGLSDAAAVRHRRADGQRAVGDQLPAALSAP
jgi:hypothetical protein